MRLYLARHGETILNKKRCYYGVTDVPLSEEGVRQGLALSSYIKEIDLDGVTASPLSRAVQTAELIMQGHGPMIQTDDRLKEQDFGIFEGYTHKELTELFPDEYRQWNQDFSHYRIPGGESFSDVRERLEDFIRDLPKEGSLLLVAHKGSLGHLTAALLGLDLLGYWSFVFEQDCISRIDLEDGCAIIRYLNRKV